MCQERTARKRNGPFMKQMSPFGLERRRFDSFLVPYREQRLSPEIMTQLLSLCEQFYVRTIIYFNHVTDRSMHLLTDKRSAD